MRRSSAAAFVRKVSSLPESGELFRAGEEALGAARLLLEHGMWADAISRSYYAMVYAVRALLATKGLDPRTHRGAVHVLGREFVVPGIFPAETAKLLTAAMAFRDRADYGMRGDLTEDDARRTVEAADLFLREARRLLGDRPASPADS